jgi:hypothetical protein
MPSRVCPAEETVMINQENRSALQSISQRINKHCGEIKRLSDALVEAQNNNPKFSLNKPFDSTKSKMLKTVLVNIVKTYESIRCDLGKIAHDKISDFENMFPKLDINFENYYTIAISMLNLIYQMQYMKIYCHTLL